MKAMVAKRQGEADDPASIGARGDVGRGNAGGAGHLLQRRPLSGMGGVAVAGDVPAAVDGQGQEGEMVPGAVVAQTLLGGAVRVPQRLRAEAAGLETASHRGDVLVAALV